METPRSATPAPEPPAVDEMHDGKDLTRQDALGEFLRLCDPRPENRVDPKHPPADMSLREAFDVADARAKDGQAKFRRITRWGAWLGMSALIVLVGRLALKGEIGRALEWLPAWAAKPAELAVHYADALLAFGACIAVIVGLVDFLHEEWLVQRFQAERHRLLKFRLLIDPRTWTRGGLGSPEWGQELAHEVQKIRSLVHLSKDSLALGEDVPRLPPPAVWSSMAFDPASPLLGDIVAYYRRRRLDSQVSYFLGRVSAHVPSIGNRRLPPLIFFGGVVCVLVAFVLDVLSGDRSAVRLFVFLGAAAPAAAAAIRTIRSAYEWERNAERSRGMHATLTRIGRYLYEEQTAQTATPQNIFAYLSLSEFALASDQREWMRLMGDAEWYG